jgi:uncharacterized membrane-anchored protein
MNWLDDIRKSILAAGAFLSLMLAGAVYVNASAVAAGQEVIVRAQGFDPRSFLSGHYVMLAYDFSNAPTGAPECAFREGARIWAGFTAKPGKNETAYPTFACARGDLPAGLVAFKGKATGYGRVNYGLERFYAPQKDAERIEKALMRFNPDIPPDKQPPVYAVMSIDKDGQARLKALLLGDERIELSWL